MRISLSYATDKSNKYDEYEVLEVVMCQPLPDGCVQVTGTTYDDDEAKLTKLPVIGSVNQVLYAAIFKVAPVGHTDRKELTTLVDMVGVLDSHYNSISWLENDAVKVINYKQYKLQCEYMEVEPLSFLQYWLHLEEYADPFRSVKIPKLDYKEPDWLTEHMKANGLVREEAA